MNKEYVSYKTRMTIFDVDWKMIQREEIKAAHLKIDIAHHPLGDFKNLEVDLGVSIRDEKAHFHVYAPQKIEGLSTAGKKELLEPVMEDLLRFFARVRKEIANKESSADEIIVLCKDCLGNECTKIHNIYDDTFEIEHTYSLEEISNSAIVH